MSQSLSNVRATLGLSAVATPKRKGVSGSLQLGKANKTTTVLSADVFYTRHLLFAASGVTGDLDVSELLFTPSASWTDGTAQKETATAAGTITTAGNATVIITSAGMSGSPKTITFAVASGDTATQWATKARAALAANAVIADRFTVSGTGTSIALERKPITTFTDDKDTSYPIYAANDTTLNIALADATSAGITEAATSTNTTDGVATAGAQMVDPDQSDSDGFDIMGVSVIYGIAIDCTGGGMQMQAAAGGEVSVFNTGEQIVRQAPAGLNFHPVQIFTANAAAMITIHLAGALL